MPQSNKAKGTGFKRSLLADQYTRVITTSDGIATLTLNRAEKRNALHGPLVAELSQWLIKLAKNDKIKIVIIAGEGESFCAGADIHWMQKMATASKKQNQADAQALANLLYQLYSFSKPTIALVHGSVLGGGLGLLAACDIALAAKETLFGLPEVKIGLIPAIVSPYIVTAIGERASQYYFLTGERFSAQEAHRLNLIHQVVAKKLLAKQGVALAQQLLQNDLSAIKHAKQFLREISKAQINVPLAHKTASVLAKLRATAAVQKKLRLFNKHGSNSDLSSSS